MENKIAGRGISAAPQKHSFKKLLSFLLAITMLFSITSAIPITAEAASNPYPDIHGNYPGNNSNCTWYAWQRTKEKLGVELPAWGNAKSWYDNAKKAGYSVSSTAAVNRIVVYGASSVNSYGHVAFVESVSGNNMTITEGGYLGGYNKRTVSKTGNIDAGTKYSAKIIGFINPVKGSSTPTVTNPSVTVNSVSDLTANSVRINFTAKNPSKVTIKTVGVQVRKKGTSDWKTKQEAMNASYTNAASVSMWWTVGSGKELNMSLTSGTAYEYRAYVVYNGKNYYSSTSTFTTKGPAPHTHNYNYVTVTIRPTCTEGGYTEYRCSCGDSYIGNYTSASGHTAVPTKAVEATCTQDGKTAGSHCSVCNAVIIEQQIVPATGHSYDTGKVTKAPTATATGIKTYTCIDCGATKKETLPATKLKKPSAKAVVNANGSFTISWGKVAGADKYDVYFDNGTGYQLLRTVTETSITTGTAHYGKKYSYKVRAVNSKNSSATSAFSAAVTATNTKRLVTPKLKAAVNANGSFTLSWNKVAGATSYQLYIKQADGSYKLMKTTNATSFTTAFATYGKQFTYKMRAVTSKNSSATSAYSSAVNAKNTKKLQTPSLKVAVNKNGSFKLSWGKVTGATSYQIYMKQSNGSYKLIKTTSSTSFTTAVAAKGKTYSYKVRAVTSKNKNATSNYSSVVNAKRK